MNAPPRNKYGYRTNTVKRGIGSGTAKFLAKQGPAKAFTEHNKPVQFSTPRRLQKAG